ncbi:MAG: ribonuclease HII [Pseudomonadota bacterium]
MPAAKPKPTFERELAIVARNGATIAGVDEAGRGPLAGPVVAAAVAFSEADIKGGLSAELAELNDSKVLKEERREQLCQAIVKHFQIGIGIAERARIDADNILNATLWAMQMAVYALNPSPTVVLIDGDKAPELEFPSETIVGGDGRCLSIAAASIVAKVKRDQIMRKLGALYPEYGFERHKGYGTKAHLEAIRRHGICDAHRRSFRPIREALERV